MRTIRRKTSRGVTATFVISECDGRYKLTGLRDAKVRGKPLPLSFVPFALTNAVVNSPSFETEAEAEHYVRDL